MPEADRGAGAQLNTHDVVVVSVCGVELPTPWASVAVARACRAGGLLSRNRYAAQPDRTHGRVSGCRMVRLRATSGNRSPLWQARGRWCSRSTCCTQTSNGVATPHRCGCFDTRSGVVSVRRVGDFTRSRWCRRVAVRRAHRLRERSTDRGRCPMPRPGMEPGQERAR